MKYIPSIIALSLYFFTVASIVNPKETAKWLCTINPHPSADNRTPPEAFEGITWGK